MSLPALRAALICEQVLTEVDGVHSAIRIVSRLQLPPRAFFEAQLLLMFATTAKMDTKDHRVLLRVENGAGEILSGTEFVVETPLEAGETFSIVVPFRFQAPTQNEMFWLTFAWDADFQVLTRTPVHFDVVKPA